MIYTTIVEQRRTDEYRNVYNEQTGTFYKSEFKSLLFERGFIGVYGWIMGYGSPPHGHLDILTITCNDYDLGSLIEIKIIGVFVRNDGDNKYIGVETGRKENDFPCLSIADRTMLMRLYPKINNGEGWFGKDKAMELIREYEIRLATKQELVTNFV